MGWTVLGGAARATSLLFLAVFFTWTAEAKLVVFSDFDGTIVEDREHAPFKGTFKTPFVLYRIPQRLSTIQEPLTGPETLEVSPHDFHRMRPHLANGNRPGSNRKYTTHSGVQVVQGEYQSLNPQTFKYFFSDTSGERNYLLEAFDKAYEGEKDAWKGGFFPIMQALLSHEETAKTLMIGTARGHSAKDWEGFFQRLKDLEEIKHLPDVAAFHNVSLEGYDRYDITGNITGRKTGLLTDIAWRLGRMVATEDRLAPDGKATGKYHYLILVEDHQTTIEAWAKEAQSLARNKRLPNNVKFGIFNFGTKTAIADARRPQFSIVTSDGTFRAATPAELVGEPSVETPELAAYSAAMGCAARLATASIEKTDEK